MDTIKEILNLKDRINNIEALLSIINSKLNPSSFDQPAEVQEINCEMVDFKFQKSVSAATGLSTYSYKVTIRNNSDNRVRLGGHVIFLDSNEFQVESYPMDPFDVLSKASTTRTGSVTIFDPDNARRIAHVTAEAYSI